MPTIRLTDRTLRSLAGDGRRIEFFDRSLAGFGLRVSPSGRLTFVLRYRNDDGRERRMSLGTYPALSLADARDRAKELLGEVARGEDPGAGLQARRSAPTFRELAAEYLERHAKPKKKSWRYDERMLERYLLRPWGRRKAAEIDRVNVMRLLDEIADRGAPYAANRVRALVSKVYAFGIVRGLVEANPARDVPQPAKPRSRQRVLTEEEIRGMWAALEDVTPLMAATFRLRLLTAQRGIEVLSMRHEDIDGDWWTIPPEVAKNGLAHRVPLSTQARAVLEKIRPVNEHSAWVFPSPRGDSHVRWTGKAAREIRTRTGFEWTPHDLRRTAATYMTGMGIPRLVVSKVLNHAESGVTAVYDRSSYDSEKRQALVAWGERLERIVAGKAAEEKVVGRIG